VIDGAVAIPLVGDHGQTTDVVSYPGGVPPPPPLRVTINMAFAHTRPARYHQGVHNRSRIAHVWLGLGLAVAGCTPHVKQDAHTGGDGVLKGAVAIPLDNDQGKATGIVTYPGGDRVDWKTFELPAKQHGKLDVRLSWVPPRPGLQLAFDVFDAAVHPVITAKTTLHSGHGRIRTASLPDAMGKYYIRIYAVGRGDAGTYKVGVAFQPTDDKPTGPGAEIPQPPHLPTVPPVDPVCDDDNFNPKLKECRAFCPAVGAPTGWAACAGQCTNADPNNPACQKTLPCPNPPDPRFASCVSTYPKCDPKAIDPANPRCKGVTPPPPPPPEPITGRALLPEVMSDGVLVTVSVGKASHLDKTWRGQVLHDDGSPVEHGEVTIIRIEERRTVVKVKLSYETITNNPTIRFYPPGN
jgi:hypothetical protein